MAIVKWIQKIFRKIKDGLRLRRVSRSALLRENADLRYKLAHANGALSDITIIVTSSVKRGKKSEAQSIAESVLRRILCSASKVHRNPAWYYHKWEEQLYKDYYGKKILACASDRASLDEAKRAPFD